MKEAADEITSLRAQLEAVQDGANLLIKSYAEEFAAREAELKAKLAEAEAACLKLCSEHGIATGHGDTVANIVGEINGYMDGSRDFWQDKCIAAEARLSTATKGLEEHFRRELRISSDLDYRSWSDILRALAALADGAKP